MKDRELLELAAKAAGLEIMPLAQEGRDKAGHGAVGLYVKFADGGVSTCWNPLTDDGDALRLAVKLRLTVKIEDHEIEVFSWEDCLVYAGMLKGDDYEAATRRAIVYAAANL